MVNQNIPDSNPSIYELQARVNEETAKLAHKDFPEWAIIMYFYAALHWINDYAYRNNQLSVLDKSDGISQHTSRKKYVKEIAYKKGCQDIYENYKFLFDESMLARYLENNDEELDSTSRDFFSNVDIKKYSDALFIIKKRLKQK